MRDRSSTENHNATPALPDELIRVRLIIAIAQRDRAVDALRAAVSDEEAQQQLLQMEIDSRIGHLKHDQERLALEVQRLESRLERLGFARRALSDTELDDEEHVERAEEAAFWAEWREQHDARRGTPLDRRTAAEADAHLKRVFRALARLIHPDLAQNPAERNRREVVMRMANAAHDARDLDQLNRLLSLWSRPLETAEVRDLQTLRARLTERDLKHLELQQHLATLEENEFGQLRRRSRQELLRHIKREQERIGREVATLRLKRRRLLAAVEDRRRELAQIHD